MLAVSTYFNSEIMGDKVPYAETVRGICFRPFHYFFEGETCEWYNAEISGRMLSYSEEDQNWQTSLKMAVLIVPGMIVGTIAAIVAWASWYFSGENTSLLCDELGAIGERKFYVAEDKKCQAEIPVYDLAGVDPQESYLALDKRWFELSKEMLSPECWKQEAFRERFSGVMEEAFKVMQLVLKDAAETAEKESGDMSLILKTRYRDAFAGPINVFGIYSMARGYRYYAMEGDGESFEIRENKTLTYTDRETCKAFYAKGTMEHRWRLLNNAAYDLTKACPGLSYAGGQRDALPDQPGC